MVLCSRACKKSTLSNHHNAQRIAKLLLFANSLHPPGCCVCVHRESKHSRVTRRGVEPLRHVCQGEKIRRLKSYSLTRTELLPPPSRH